MTTQGYEHPAWAGASMIILEAVGLKNFIYGIIAAFAFTSSAPAFANAFKDFYRPYPVNVEDIMKSKSKPEVFTSENLQLDTTRGLEAGYVILGVSDFVGTLEDHKQATALAKKLKASIVLINYRYVETVSGGSRTVIMPVFGGVGAVGHTEPVSYTRYQQTAVFFAKYRPERIGLGINYRDLTSDEARKLANGRAIAVNYVIKDSPAFEAGIISGDIILHIANQDIASATRMEKVKTDYSGQTVPVAIARNGERITLQMTMPVLPVSSKSKKAK